MRRRGPTCGCNDVSAAVERRPSLLPIAWAIFYVVAFGSVLFSISWSFGDTVPLMQKAARLEWREAIVDAFARGVEYRPLFMLSIKAFLDTFGTPVWLYQSLVLLQFGAVLSLVVWLCLPLGVHRALAACLAVSVLCALHSTRILFGFWPLNQHSGVLVLVLLTIALAFREETRRFDWTLGVIALAAMFGLELGLLLAPVIVILWLSRAPGVGWRGAASVAVAAGLYVAIRLSLGTESGIPASHNENGFGFSMITPAQVDARFGSPPLLLWIYNAGSTLLTVLFSEPRDGVFSFVESWLARDMESWRWFHVGLSALTTAIVVLGLIVRSPRSSRDRLLVVLGVALLVFGSGLGFLYTRDRIALSAGVGYALLVYVAASALMDWRPARHWVRLASRCALIVIAAGWIIRSGELLFQLRDTAWDYHLEWTARFSEKGGSTEDRTAVFEALRKEALSQVPADPRTDPGWTYVLFERRFTRSAEAR